MHREDKRSDHKDTEMATISHSATTGWDHKERAPPCDGAPCLLTAPAWNGLELHRISRKSGTKAAVNELLRLGSDSKKPARIAPSGAVGWVRDALPRSS
jgi:hypothetical protein